jgi:GPI mannosyltransferase 1 subunit M
MNGGSPYARKTYRYTPIAAYICVVNNLIHPLGCKVVFCVIDILMAMVYWRLCDSQLQNAVSKTGSTMLYVAIGWMFNPLVIQISTRGSNDNIISFLVFVSLWLLLKHQYVLAGLFYGLSVHFKIYPIIYCFVLYFFIDSDKQLLQEGKVLQAITSAKGFFTRDRLVFTAVSALTFLGLTGLFYAIYGWECLYESLLYHLIRGGKDNRHNNSVYWYYTYLLYDEPDVNVHLKFWAFIPQWFCVIAAGVFFYYDLFLALFL